MQRLLVVLAILTVSAYAQVAQADPPTVPSAVLTIAKQAVGTAPMSPPAPAGALIPGNLVTFTNLAENDGPAAALNMRISDPLPSETVFISAVASPGATLTTPAVGANGTVTSTWDAAGGTPAGLTGVDVQRTLTVVARICPEAGCVDLENTATTSAAAPSVPDDSTIMVPLFPASNLMIQKSASVEKIDIGESFTYLLNVSNAGPSNSATTQVVDTLPPGFVATGVQSTIPGATCDIELGGSVVTCTFALGAANQCMTTVPTSGTITIEVLVTLETDAGIHTNTATIGVAGDCGYDPSPQNNTAAARVQAIGRAGAPAVSQVGLAGLAILLSLGGAWMLGRRRAH